MNKRKPAVRRKSRKKKGAPRTAKLILLLAAIAAALCVLFFCFSVLTVRQTPDTESAQNLRLPTTRLHPTEPDAPSPASPKVPPSERKSPIVAAPSGGQISSKIPQAVNNPVLIFVFDDAGQSMAQLPPFLALPFPITVAVLPGLPHSIDAAAKIRESGAEVILHQPMQAKNLAVNPGPGAINPDMDAATITTIVRKNIAEIAPIVGMNNHEGSLVTESQTAIGAVLDVCAEQGIYFLDSRTTAATKAPAAAKERGMTIRSRDIFLDNTPDKDDILAELYRGLDVANRNGTAIFIGHVWSPKLPAILLELYPQLVEQGYRFATISTFYK